MLGVFWKAARIGTLHSRIVIYLLLLGERLSPYVSLCCLVMAVKVIMF